MDRHELRRLRRDWVWSFTNTVPDVSKLLNRAVSLGALHWLATPGPWAVQQMEKKCRIVRPELWPIAETMRCVPREGNDGMPSYLVDATLLAAAPEMSLVLQHLAVAFGHVICK